MGAFKPSTADAMQVAKTPSLPTDVVRLEDQQAALANVPTVGQMSSAIAAVAQSPTQIATDNSLICNLISPNSFQIAVRLAPNGLIQAGQTGLTGTQSIVSAWTEIVLGYEQVSSVVVTRNLIAGGAVTFTGVQGVDYYLDSFDGYITITPNSGLINSSESPQVTQIQVAFNCAQIDSGGGLVTVGGGSAGGLEVDWGYDENQVAPGNAVAKLQQFSHWAAAPDPAAVTTTTTVDELQRIRTEVNLALNGYLLESSNGLAVNLPGIVSAVEAQIGYATSSQPGLMTPAQVAELGALAAELPAVWGTTDSIELGQDSFGNVTANIITGIGITVGYVTTTGNTGTGLFGNEYVWYDLSLNPANWPTGWPNVLFWGIGVASGTITFSIYSDSAGQNLLASGNASVSGLLAAATPQTLTLYNPSSVIVGSLAINTTTPYPVQSTQEIVLTPVGVSADLTTLALRSTTDSQQQQIDALETESSSTSSSIAFLEAEVATLGENLLTPANINDFNCLATLLEKWEFAHRLIPMLRMELPNLTAGNSPAPAMVPERQIYSAGTSNNVYSVNFQIAGVVQLKYYWAGAPVAGSTRCVKGGTPYDVADPRTSPWPPGGWPPAGQDPLLTTIEEVNQSICDLNPANSWALIISDDGTGTQQTYYLNAALNDADQNGGPQVLNYTITGINIKGGATATLVMVSSGSATVHSLVVPDAGPYPASFPGYFMQVDASGIANICSLGDIAADGTVDGIAIFGGPIRKDLDLIDGGPTGSNDSSSNYYPALNGSPEVPGWNGAAAVGTNGTDIPSGNGPQSTANQPIIDLPRDLLRLGMMDGGNADDRVYDILVNGNDIWVAGAFTRWGNTPCPGLVRLDHLGRLSHTFNNFRAGFSEPVRHLAMTSDGNIMAATIFPSMYQNNASKGVHKILSDGTEDLTFTAPDQIAINDLAHPNLVIDVACLSDGKVAVLTPRGLTVLNANGSIFSQQDSGGTDMFLALLGVPGTTSLLLSSHAWSSLNQPCQFGNVTIPRGLKLLDESVSNFQLDATWANPAFIGLPALGAGTGAMASCMRAVAAPGSAYFVVGNGLARYNGIDTSWNTQILGNLLRYSEALNNHGAWYGYGTITETGSGTVPAGVTGNAESWILDNSGGIGTQAFLQQSASVAPNATCVLQFYLLKQVAANYPIVQMQFAGSSSGASSGGGGGTAIEAYAWLDPSGTNAPLLVNVSGNGSPSITMTAYNSTWFLVTMTLTNASQDTDLNVTFFPAYSDTYGGTSTSVSGSIQISAPEVIYNYWSSQYVPTTSAPALPTESQSNANRFRGLYKIDFNGAADPNFNCNMTYGDDGMAIPFAIDGYGNIYCGGPITSIADSNGVIHQTTPWMLYKLNSNGQFLAQYSLFDDEVMVARITPYGNLVVGGKFQFYGSYACGHFVMIDPWGNLIRDPVVLDDPVIFSSSSSFPDVIAQPGLKTKLLVDGFTDPPSEYVWSNDQGTWVQAGSGGFTQLPPVSITTLPAVPPNLWVPGESGFDGSSPLDIIMADAYGGVTIWYTLDGSDPRILTNPSRTMYPWNASAGSYPTISQPTIITAYATLPGYANSVLTTVTYGQQLVPPVISPASENIPFPVAVTITGPLGATIWYTTDGSNPATSGTAIQYSGGFNIGTPNQTAVTVLAVAKQTGYFTSPQAQANYGENIMPALTFTPAGGAGVPVSVVIALPASFTAPYTIYYTTSTTGQPSTPTLLSPNAAGPLTLQLAVGTAIEAFAVAPGWTNSPLASAAYGLAIANPPTITLPPAGSGLGTTIITASASGPVGQSIVYTVNGGAPVTALSPAGVDLSDIPGVNGVVTITAYSTYPGWSNSPTATATTVPLLLSGLIDVNFAPPSAATKVGRMAIFSNPFTDIWNVAGATPGLLSTLQENFYSDGSGTAQAPGAPVGTQLSFSPGSGTFGVIPFVGDDAYKNFLQIASTNPTSNIFESVAYGFGTYVAVTSGGEIFTAPDAINWTAIQTGLPQLTRAVAFNIPSSAATSFSTTITYAATQWNGWTISSPPTPLSGYTMTIINPSTSPPVITNGEVVIQFVGAAGPYPQTPGIGISLGGSSTGLGASSVVNTNNGTSGYSALFVLGTGLVLTSQNGVNWTNITANLPANFTVNDIAVTTAGGATQLQIVGSSGRQFACNIGVTPLAWIEITPAANIGANLNSKAINTTGAAQYQMAVGDAGTIFNVNGGTLVPNAYDEVSFTRATVNPLINLFAFVSLDLNGVTKAYTATTGAIPAFTPSGPFPSGTTNLLDICPYQYGFIAVGDRKILLGNMVSGVLDWTDITPETSGGSSSGGGGSYGSISLGIGTGLTSGHYYLAQIATGESAILTGAYSSSNLPGSGTFNGPTSVAFFSLAGTTLVFTGPSGTVASKLYVPTITGDPTPPFGGTFVAGKYDFSATFAVGDYYTFQTINGESVTGYSNLINGNYNFPITTNTAGSYIILEGSSPTVSSDGSNLYAPAGANLLSGDIYPGGSSGSSGSDMGPIPFNYKGVTVNAATGEVIVVGDGGIIYGSFTGSVWVWNYSNQMTTPPLPPNEVMRGTFSNLTPGFYDLLIYGHGSLASENSTFHAYADGVQVADINNVLAPTTASDATFQNTNWELDRQFVKFSDIETDTGTIAIGVAPSGVTGTAYLIEIAQWVEYGTSAGGFTLLGSTATSVLYSTLATNPGVAVGAEITSMAVIGPTSSSSAGPAGTTLQRNTTRYYYLGSANSYSGFINAIQLSRRSGAGVRMGLPSILPETLDNLPFPENPNGLDLMGIFLAPSDVALGISPVASIYYSIVNCTYSQYETYLASGATAAGLAPDPTIATGTLYPGPLAIADNGVGVLVRAIATCIGRTTSRVAAAFYWPAWPESSSWGQ